MPKTKESEQSELNPFERDIAEQGPKETDSPQPSLAEQEQSVSGSDPVNKPKTGEENWATSVGQGGIGPSGRLKNLTGWIKGNPGKSGGLGMAFVALAAVIIMFLQSLVVVPFLSFANAITGVNFAGFDAITSLRIKDVLIFTKATKSLDLTYTRLGIIGSAMSVNLDRQFAKNGVFIDQKLGTVDGFTIDLTKGDFPIEKDSVQRSNRDLKRSLIAEGIPESAVVIEGDVVKIKRPGLFHPLAERKIISVLHGGNREVGNMVGAAERKVLRKRIGWTQNPITRVDAQYRKTTFDLIKFMSDYFTKQFSSGTDAQITTTSNSDKDSVIDPDDPNPPETADADSQIQEARKGNLKAKAGGAVGFTVGLVCVGKYIYENAATVNQVRAQAPLMQIAGEFISVASKIKNGEDVDQKTLAEWYRLIQADLEGNKSSWSGARTINYDEGNGAVGVTLPGELNPNPGADSALGEFFNNSVVEDGCNIIESGAVQVISFALAPAAYLVEETLFAAADSLGLIEKFLALFYNEEVILAQEKYYGAVIGEAGGIGAYLIDNQAAGAVGGGTKNTAQANELRYYAAQDKILQDKNKSIAEKYLSPYNTDTPVSKAVVAAQTQKPIQLIANIPNTIASTLKLPLSSTVGADDNVTREEVYYGIAKIGFTPSSFKKINENPYVNAEEARQLLLGEKGEEYKQRLLECNSIEVTVSETDLDFSSLEGTAESPVLMDSIKPDPKCAYDESDVDFLKIRIAVLDTYVAKSYACVMFSEQGFSQYCDELLGVSANSGTGVTGSGTIVTGSFNLLGAHHTAPGGKKAELDSGVERMQDAYELITSNDISLIGLQEFEKSQRAEFKKLANGDWSVHPADGSNDNLQASNSVAWKTNEFELEDSGFHKGLRYFTESGTREMWVPWVELKHKQTGKLIHFTNTHDPINKGGADAQTRADNARKHLANAKEALAEEGVSFVMAGDFNSGFKTTTGSRAPNRDSLPYCILTQDGTLYNTYDTNEGRTYEEDGACPIKDNSNVKDAIDHVYHSPDVGVTGWERISTGDISDHPLIVAELSIAVGATVSADGFAFPVIGGKTVIQKGYDGAIWCYNSPTNCHHNYNAADIHAPPGTTVVAARSGKVVDVKSGGGYGMRITIKADDNLLYYYTHMKGGSEKVSKGQSVKAGDAIGEIGTNADAQNTPAHLHLDVLPGDIYDFRPGCAFEDCKALPFIDIQPVLYEVFKGVR
jgi:murein DD-endopeptidase MepM/ murein hydrolase activator NlpD